MSVSEMDSGVVTKPVPNKVQIVNRKSSEELLRKFADPDDDEKPTTKPRKRMKKTTCRRNGVVEDDDNDGVGAAALVERKRLLAPVVKRRSLFLRQFANGRSHLKNRSLVRSLGKTWRRTVEGASRVFIEKHYNSHRRLINDAI
ncbi:PREDICTED: uncharacterized protein LOC104802563 [Tarenaya hassleriana]|uniref:uncharacterized protein LOC104802563 n=1 Tax=Tarenaya hassleriana TaxID=28532 RepID=UPI00053C8CA0|nr:PREDICTED: uncharacterized protein LOC104802563 [Tarenaya hassleriana]